MKKIKDYLIELSLIVLGVFIAISVDDYRENTKAKAMLSSYFTVMKEDLRDNIILIDDELLYDSLTIAQYNKALDKFSRKDYKYIDSATVHLTYESKFTINDTGFRMMVQSGESHGIETAKLAQLNELFGSAQTDLNFFQTHDTYVWQMGQEFINKNHPLVETKIHAHDASIEQDVINLLFVRRISLTSEFEEKKKMKKKIVEVLAMNDL